MISTVPWSVEPGLAHLPLRILEIHDPRADLGVDAFGDREHLAVAGVEPLRDVARQLEVLALVVADRNDVGLVQEDVPGHQHRVLEQRGRDELLLVALLLELRHPAQLAVARGRAEQPRRLGVRGHLALHEHRRAVGIEPGREQHRRDVQRQTMQLGRVVLDRDRVQVDDAEEGLALLLRARVLAEPARVVAERRLAGRLDAGEDSLAHRPSRKLSAIAEPCGVSTDSGWNWMPSIGSSRWRMAITSPSAAVAETSNSSGTRVTASEW